MLDRRRVTFERISYGLPTLDIPKPQRLVIRCRRKFLSVWRELDTIDRAAVTFQDSDCSSWPYRMRAYNIWYTKDLVTVARKQAECLGS
jgi:hypothetical protein